MYSVSKKYADFQQNLFWKHKDPRCIQDEVMSYRGVKFPEKIDQKAVPQQQQQTEKDRAVDQEIKLMARGIEVYERIIKKVTIPCEEKKKVNQSKPVDRVESNKLKVELKNKDGKINYLTNTLLNQRALTKKQSLEIKILKDKIINAETDQKKKQSEMIRKKKVDANIVLNLQKELDSCENELSKEQKKVADLKLQHSDTNKIILDTTKDLKRSALENIRQKKLNANIVANLQKEVDGNEKQLMEERKKVKDLLAENKRISQERKGDKELSKVMLQLQMDVTARREAVIKNLSEHVSSRDQALLNAHRDLKKMKLEKFQQDKFNATIVVNLQNEIDDSKNKLLKERKMCEDLKVQNAIVLKEKMNFIEDLEARAQNKSTTNSKLSQDIVNLTKALSSKANENQSLTKNLVSSRTKIKDLQVSLEKALSDLNHSKKIGDKEKNIRNTLNKKLMDVTNEKDAQIAKLEKKLEATKTYLATISREKQQEKQYKAKAHKNPQLTSGKDDVVQSEEKSKRKRKKNKESRSSLESLEINKSFETVNSLLLLKGEGKMIHIK